MRMRVFILAITVSLIAANCAFAERHLDSTEISELFETLTAEPRNTWIAAGTIEATHLEYKSAKAATTQSDVIVKYDGNRFYWEINILSHAAQIRPQMGRDAEPSPDDLDLNWNKKRVFAWDGQQYTRYFRPGNHAIINESPSDIPVAVNGPLTAGIVPWGHGVYTLESLLAAESSALIDDQGQVQLILNKPDMPEINFVLDPAKDYAVLYWSSNYAGLSSIIKTYRDYKQVSGRWIPTTIVIKRYNDSKQPSELVSYDEWDLTYINVNIPPEDSFDVVYETGALVECYSPIVKRPLSYRYSGRVDADGLLQDRLAILFAGDTRSQNCAMAAMKYVAVQSGKNVGGQKLAELVNDPNKGTSLYQMKQFAQQLGLNCLAVKTDIQTLKTLQTGCTILHLPKINHYVVLEHVDDEYVWLIDLDSNKFYYRTKIDVFGLDWTEGVALLISDEPLYLQPASIELNGDQMREIIGGFPNYSCTDVIQEEDEVLCPEPVGGLCGGRYYKYPPRYGCEPNDLGGTCFGSPMPRILSSPCINNPECPGDCEVTNEWFGRYIIRACE